MRTVQKAKTATNETDEGLREGVLCCQKNVINYLMGLNVQKKVIYHSVGYSGDELAIIYRN